MIKRLLGIPAIGLVLALGMAACNNDSGGDSGYNPPGLISAGNPDIIESIEGMAPNTAQAALSLLETALAAFIPDLQKIEYNVFLNAFQNRPNRPPAGGTWANLITADGGKFSTDYVVSLPTTSVNALLPSGISLVTSPGKTSSTITVEGNSEYHLELDNQTVGTYFNGAWNEGGPNLNRGASKRERSTVNRTYTIKDGFLTKGGSNYELSGVIEVKSSRISRNTWIDTVREEGASFPHVGDEDQSDQMQVSIMLTVVEKSGSTITQSAKYRFSVSSGSSGIARSTTDMGGVNISDLEVFNSFATTYPPIYTIHSRNTYNLAGTLLRLYDYTVSLGNTISIVEPPFNFTLP